MNLSKVMICILAALSISVAGACGDDGGSDNNMAPNNANPDGQQTGTVVKEGIFENVDGTPKATGPVSIRERDDGTRFVYLGQDFSQQMGPGDTEVRLAKSSENVGAQLDADPANVSDALGVIPNGASGTFSFDIPSQMNAEEFSHVIIWCPTAEINFGVAEFGGDSGADSDGDQVVAEGTITNNSGNPTASGSFTITDHGDDTYTLSLGSDFEQGQGPGDTEIRLATSDDNIQAQIDADPATVSAAIGSVPNGGSGAQEFEFSGIDPADFSHLVIWCPTAAINFGAGSYGSSS